MSWATPSTQVTGYLVTSSDWNQDVVANPAFLYSPPMGRLLVSSDFTYTNGTIVYFVDSGATAFLNGGASTGSNALYPNTAGVYEVSAGVYCTFSGSPTGYNFYIQANIGGTNYTVAQEFINGVISTELTTHASGPISMGSSDYVAAYLDFQGTPGTITVKSVPQTFLSIAWRGAL